MMEIVYGEFRKKISSINIQLGEMLWVSSFTGFNCPFLRSEEGILSLV